jgi:hypothetical protein
MSGFAKRTSEDEQAFCDHCMPTLPGSCTHDAEHEKFMYYRELRIDRLYRRYNEIVRVVGFQSSIAHNFYKKIKALEDDCD